MYSENNTSEIIKARMFGNIPSDISKVEGTFTHDMVAVSSLELEQAYINLDQVLEIVFAATSYGDYLTMRAAEFGVYRKQGTKAKATLTFTGTVGAVVPANTEVQTENGLSFFTDQELILEDVTGTVTATAEDVGTIYNVPSTLINVLPIAVTGITSVANNEPSSGGVDVESDDELRERLDNQVKNPATSGNAYHYFQWALQVSGIGDAHVYPAFNGPNTVKVVVISSEKRAVDSEKVTEVYNHIEANRPVGANVTVVSGDEKEVDITVSIQKSDSFTESEVQESVERNITEHLKDIAFKQQFVSYAVIGSLILQSDGVVDYQDYELNGATVNLALDEDETPVLGSVTITWL